MKSADSLPPFLAGVNILKTKLKQKWNLKKNELTNTQQQIQQILSKTQ